jgi:hypothetical protein
MAAEAATAQQPTVRDAAPAHVCASFVAADGWHDVFVALDEGGRWQVLDLSSARLALVETLTGHDDRLRQAEALGRDYAREQAAYSSGRRTADPLPRPQILATASRPA